MGAVGGLRGLAVDWALYPEFGIGAAIGDGVVFAEIHGAFDAEGGQHFVVEGGGCGEVIGAKRDVGQGAL